MGFTVGTDHIALVSQQDDWVTRAIINLNAQPVPVTHHPIFKRVVRGRHDVVPDWLDGVRRPDDAIVTSSATAKSQSHKSHEEGDE
jgi:hypothetical protein